MNALVSFVAWRLGLRKADTWTSPAERDCLARHAAARRRLCEIGVWHGAAACRIREAMAPDATLFLVDPFDAGRLGVSYPQIIAHREVGRIRRGAVVWLRETGVAAAAKPVVLAEPFDFVDVDADHSWDGLRGDWDAWSGLVAPGGVIALHETGKPGGMSDHGTRRFCDEVAAKDPRFEPVEIVDLVTVLRRRA